MVAKRYCRKLPCRLPSKLKLLGLAAPQGEGGAYMTNVKGVRALTLGVVGAALLAGSNCLSQDVDTNGGPSGASSSSGSSTSTGAGGVSANTSGGSLSGGSETSGTGLFAKLPFELSFSLNEGYDDNANNVSIGKKGSAFTSGAIDVAYDFGDPRLQLSLMAGLGGTYYYEDLSIQNYDIDLHGGLNVVYKASPRLTLRSKLFVAYLTEPSFNFGYGVNRRTGNYFLTLDQFTIAYQWLPRFSTATSYTIDALNYDDRDIGQFEDRVENTLGNEFRFQLVPTTALVAEYRFQIIDYRYIMRDSTTHYLLGGLDHSFTPRFQGSIRAGVEFRDYDEGENRTEPYVETTVTYASGKRSSVSWTNRYGLEEPDFPQVPSRKTFRTGLQIKQELISRLSGQLGFFYQHDDNQGVTSSAFTFPSFAEDSFDIGISARYTVTHYIAVQAGYEHTEVLSDIALREYNRNRVYGGVTIAF